MILATVTTLFSLVSCATADNGPKSISVEATTFGFIDGVDTTLAKWTSDETVELYRSENWQSAIFTITSGAGEALANFKGTILDSEKFYALRSTTPAHIVEGKAAISVPSKNIFLADENSSLVAPQIGEGTAQGVKFTPIFGAIKFAVTGDFATQTIKVRIPNKEIGINGDYFYDVVTNTLRGQDVEYSSTRTFDTPLTLSDTPQMVYVALPEGDYSKVELRVVNHSTGDLFSYIAENITINQGAVTDATNIRSNKLVEVTGTWHMASYCDSPANIDLYIVFTEDMKFTMYQRSATTTYNTFSGSYTIDSQTAVITGEYNDGTAWANSYKISYSGDNLVLTNTANSTEISVYEPAKVPTIHSTKMRAASVTDVKPL